MKKIFIAFTGPEINQKEAICKIADNFECWNLKKFTLDFFVESIQKQISPRNGNVLKNYKISKADKGTIGLIEKRYKECSWGLLLPDIVPDVLVNGYEEDIFLLNLYTPNFLYPVFYVTDFGISRVSKKGLEINHFHEQNKSDLFKKPEFTDYFNSMIHVSVYGSWQRDRCKKWDKEDWRLFVACCFFNSLDVYENSKDMIMWQREAADMITILESLFTAGDVTNEEVGYRLRKRVAALVSNFFPEIEKNIKELYSQRSSFIHGGFFVNFMKEVKNEASVSAFPIPNFAFLYKQKEYVRFLLVGYLYLHEFLKNNVKDFADGMKVIDLLESAIIDVKLRDRLINNLAVIYKLIPGFPSF